MHSKNVTKNYIYNLIYQILLIILPTITTPYLSRVIGADGIGVYSYLISITTYFILFGSLGTSMYLQREIAYVQEDIKKRSKVFWEIFILKAISLSLSMLIFYFAFVVDGEYNTYYRILFLEILANVFDITGFFQGMEEFKKIIKRNIIIRIISVISIFLFVKDSTDISLYLLIYVFTTVFGNLSLWLYMPKYITKIKIKELELKKHIKPIIVLFIPQIATQVYTVLDKTMLGALVVNKAEVGYYEQALKIVKMLMTLVTSLGIVMLPRIANEYAKGKNEEIKKSILNSFSFIYFISIPMIVGLSIIAKEFVPWFLGIEFDKSIYIIYIVSPIILLIGLSNVIGTQYLLPTQRQKKYTISVLVGAIVNLILNFILIPRFLSYGAAIGTVIAELAVTSVQLYCIRNEFSVKEILFVSKKYVIATLVMIISISLINRLISNLQFWIKIIIGVIVYIGTLIILKEKYTNEYICKLFKVINKNKEKTKE